MKAVTLQQVIAALVAQAKGNLNAQVDAHVTTEDGEEVEICLNLDTDVAAHPPKGTPTALRLEFIPCLGNILYRDRGVDYEEGLNALRGEIEVLETILRTLKERIGGLASVHERCEGLLDKLERV